MSKKQSKKHSSRKKSGNRTQERKQKFKLENGWALSQANCPYCNSTETYMSLYQDCRYCNKCDRTYDDLDVLRLKGEVHGNKERKGSHSI